MQTKLTRSIRNVIRGAGGGGEEQHTPVEAPDSLRSTSYAKVLDLLGEGEMFGPADPDHPLRCVFYNETPIENADGSLNFRNLSVAIRNGTQVQEPIKNFDSTENELAVSVELKYAVPWTQAINNTTIDAVRIRLAVQVLTKAETNGDVNGTSVQYAIDVNTDGGGFIEKYRNAFTGKTTSLYARTHRIDLPPANNGWLIRVRRLTPDSTSSALQNKTYVQSYAELVDAKLRYPMSALVGHIVDAEQFNNIPSRSYHWKGRIVQVPTNYNPDTRQYSGVWNGTFKPAYTNNPAWVFYDMVLHPRYGLGHLVDSTMVDKWALYKIGRYCDELVPDGFGGVEPRFTCNLYLQSREDATKVMLDLASVFRGIMYYGASQIVAVGDAPESPTYLYTAANVLEGRFNYSGSDMRARHTVALVTWNDLADFGRQKIEYVEDAEGLARYGYRETQVMAMGCTSQGQAHRLGRYILLTERYETDVVNFAVGLDGGMVPAPGKIVQIADPMRAGKRKGGRVASVETLSVVTLDDATDVVQGDTITFVRPDGQLATSTVAVRNGNQVELATPLSVEPQIESVWLAQSDELAAQTYRVIAVEDKVTDNEIRFEVTAVQHVPDKFDAVDFGTQISERPISQNDSIPLAPTNLYLAPTVRYGHGVAHNYLEAYWDHMPNAQKYGTQWRKDDGPWSEVIEVRDPHDYWEGAFAGTYRVRVWGVNAQGFAGESAISDPVTIGDPVLPIVDLDIDNVTGVLTIDCRFSQFRLLIDQDITQTIFTHVAPQDALLIEVTMGGNGGHTWNLGANVTPVSGVPYTPTPAVGTTDVVGLATNDEGVTWWLTSQQPEQSAAEPLVVSIVPNPAIGSAQVVGGAPIAPTLQVTSSVTGGMGPHTVKWTRADANGGPDFLIDNDTLPAPTFTIAAGIDSVSATQTWRATYTDAEGRTAASLVPMTLSRVAEGQGGGGSGFSVEIIGDEFGSCDAYAEGGACSPIVGMTAVVQGAGEHALEFTWVRLAGVGGFFSATNTQSTTYALQQGSVNMERYYTVQVTVRDLVTNQTASATHDFTLVRTANSDGGGGQPL